MSTQNTQIIIYHNPRCSKSRKTLEMLRERGHEPKVIEYLKTPPSRDTLNAVLQLLKMEPRDLIRTKEPIYKQTNLDNPELSHTEIIDVLIKHPILIERPIVLANGRAALGRPPENVLKIL